MCGIAGIFSFGGQKVQPNDIRAMCAYMHERGPDQNGFFEKENVLLGHQRLSIIDLSQLGAQPMQDQDLVIVFNGEIYNYIELKNELRQNGVEFKSQSDTEVLLKGYIAWGFDGLNRRIDGMFAMTLVDFKNKKAFLSRDRFGKKPLYYAHQNNRFVFASDIRSVKQNIAGTNIDTDALHYYFTELSVPQPKTIYKEIKQLPAASWMSVDLVTGTKTNPQSFWALPAVTANTGSETEVLEQVETLLTKAILKRTIADVPVGCFLSGGIDSGLIVSLLAQNVDYRVKTFTVGFAEDDFNELPYAKQLAERYNTDHHEIFIKPDIKNEIESLVAYFGEPFADSSCLPTYYVCREMGKHIKVALSGDGGDELFGYPNYVYALTLDELEKQLPSNNTSRNIKVAFSKIASRLSKSTRNIGAMNHSLKNNMDGHLLDRNMAFTHTDIGGLLLPDLMPQQNYTRVYHAGIWKSSLQNTLADTVFRASTHTRLLNDYLVKVDRSSMKSSIEVRSPFLDKSLAEFAFSTPASLKLKDHSAKYLLKKLAQKHIDPNILQRKKQGFGIPVKHWLRNELKPFVNEVLNDTQLKQQNIFDPVYVRQLIAGQQKDLPGTTHKLWSLLWFNIWYTKNA